MNTKGPSILSHLRDIFILPFSVTVIIPYFFRPHSFFTQNYIALDVIGAIIGLSGFSLFLYTVTLFRNLGKGTLAPWSPTQRLVVVGPYRYCRNPMITGVFFILIGQTLIFQSKGLLTWAFFFLLINTTYFLLKEEPDLEKRFGEDYRKYKQHVPRWIPKHYPYPG